MLCDAPFNEMCCAGQLRRCHAGDALAQQQVAQLIWRVADDASPHVAPLLTGALAFLLQTMDSLAPEQVAGSGPHAACMRQCLSSSLHVLSRRCQVLEAAGAGMKAAPLAVTRHLVRYVEAVADGKVASAHAGDLRELLEEFFDMQRMVRPCSWHGLGWLPTQSALLHVHE